MKLFQHLLVAGAAVSLIAPLAAQASDVNLEGINSYSRSKKKSTKRFDSKTFINEVSEDLAILNGRVDGLEAQQNNFDAGSFSTTTSASFGADFVVGSIDNASSEVLTFNYQFGMDLSTSFTGEDELALTIETGNGTTPVATTLDMNSMSDAMTLDGISYTFPIGDKTTIIIGDSTDVSSLYSTACTYSAFTDRLGDCGTGTSAGLGGGTANKQTSDTSDDPSSATIAAAFDFGNGFTVSGGMSSPQDGLGTESGMDVYGLQAAYNTDTYGVSISYAATESASAFGDHPSDYYDTTFWGVNGFYSFDSGLPSISVGYEAENRAKNYDSASFDKSGFFLGLTWDDFGPGSLSTGLSSVTNYKDSETEYYQYEAAYSYPVNDGMTVTPGVFVKETSGDDETGVIVTTSFSF